MPRGQGRNSDSGATGEGAALVGFPSLTVFIAPATATSWVEAEWSGLEGVRCRLGGARPGGAGLGRVGLGWARAGQGGASMDRRVEWG